MFVFVVSSATVRAGYVAHPHVTGRCQFVDRGHWSEYTGSTGRGNGGAIGREVSPVGEATVPTLVGVPVLHAVFFHVREPR